jgi:hypothetical protein
MKYLRRDSSMGASKLREVLEDEHKCTIGYDTVADGRNIALKQLHGSWENSFESILECH